MPSPKLEIHGLVLDLARLTERHEFYFDLLERLAGWGFSHLFLHLSDDQGFALTLDSHPELASPHAFTKAEMRRFVAAAKRHGIEIVPKIETLGHARYITSHPRYAHLADGSAKGFNAVCPSHPDTLKLLRDILAETAELFDSPLFSGCLDEVDFSGCPRCARRARGKGEHWVFARHVVAVERILRSAGKRMIMAADHVEKTPELLDLLPRSVVLGHWHYEKISPPPIRRSLAAGFDVICASALCHWLNLIQPCAQNFDNMDAIAVTAARLARKGPGPGRVLGVVTNWWTPYRGPRDAYLPAVAYAGAVLNGGPADRVEFLRGYLKETFGLDSLPAARALWGLYERPMPRFSAKAILCTSEQDIAEAAARAGKNGFAADARQTARHAKTLTAAAKRVRRARPEYDALVLAADVQAFCFAQGLRLRTIGEIRGRDRLTPAALKKLAAVGRETLDALDEMIARVGAEWDRTRHARDPKKFWTKQAMDCPTDHLLGRMVRSREYLIMALREETTTLAGASGQ